MDAPQWNGEPGALPHDADNHPCAICGRVGCDQEARSNPRCGSGRWVTRPVERRLVLVEREDKR